MQASTRSSSTEHWRLIIDTDGVAWLALDKADASVNSLSRGVMEELGAKLEILEKTPPRALILTSSKQGFIAGADIKEFVGLETPEQAYRMIRDGQLLLDRLAALPCVSVAAI